MQQALLLDYLGITQWYPNKFSHPWYANNKLLIEITQAIFQVKCLVLLPVKDVSNKIDLAVQKVLTGMLGVLKLTATELAIAKIAMGDRILTVYDWQQIFAEVAVWQPKFILQLDKTVSFASACSKAIVLQTYHPEHLLHNPADKAIAYRDLLTLK